MWETVSLNVGKTMSWVPPMTGNGSNHTTYKHGDLGDDLWHCFTMFYAHYKFWWCLVCPILRNPHVYIIEVDVPCTGDNHVRRTMVGTCRDHIRFLGCNIQVACKAAFKNGTVARTACNYFWMFTLTYCGWLWTPAPWTSENRTKIMG